MALILVVDDEFLLAMLLADLLEDEGHEVAVASHGVEALEKIRVITPTLVITDFMMPMMTGLELAQAVNEDATLKGLPIIFVSGAQGAIARNHSHLFYEILDKPYNNEQILALVDKIVTSSS